MNWSRLAIYMFLKWIILSQQTIDMQMSNKNDNENIKEQQTAKEI